jgi:hypothetical protein
MGTQHTALFPVEIVSCRSHPAKPSVLPIFFPMMMRGFIFWVTAMDVIWRV